MGVGRPVRWIGSPARFFRQKRRYAASRPRATLCLAHAAPGIPNSSLFLPLRLHTVQRAREEGSDRSAARLTGSGRFGNRGEKCKSSRTDGAGRSRTGKRSIGEGASGPRAPPRGPLLIDGTGSFNQYLRHVVPTWANMYFFPRSYVTYMYC